jgi:hypothetical protein
MHLIVLVAQKQQHRSRQLPYLGRWRRQRLPDASPVVQYYLQAILEREALVDQLHRCASHLHLRIAEALAQRVYGRSTTLDRQGTGACPVFYRAPLIPQKMQCTGSRVGRPSQAVPELVAEGVQTDMLTDPNQECSELARNRCSRVAQLGR